MLFLYGNYSFDQMEGLKRRYGDLVSIGIGTQYAVLVNSFELMKDLFKRQETLDRFEFQIIKERNRGRNLGILTYVKVKVENIINVSPAQSW